MCTTYSSNLLICLLSKRVEFFIFQYFKIFRIVKFFRDNFQSRVVNLKVEKFADEKGPSSSNIFTSGRFFKVAFHGFMLYNKRAAVYARREFV